VLQAGADVNAGSPETPLTIAAGKGLVDCIKRLLEAGADANIPDEVSFLPAI
jgi:ankyrin repeat protein